MLRDQTEDPGREAHRDVSQIGDMNLILVAREDPWNDQVVGSSDYGEKSHARRASRCMQPGQ